MRLIEIKTHENGSHNNGTWDIPGVLPDGWAVIPEDMVCDAFPFGEVEVEEVDGVMVVTKWTPGVIPETEPEQYTAADNSPSTLPDASLSD